MISTRGNILWIDDEIEHLKPHILFLEEKGYKITQARNEYDALELSMVNAYDLILLDQSMPGMDGIEILTKLKEEQNKSYVVIMITKTEDEWLMNEAITEQVEQFLTKPVNPSQIFMACKQVLEKNKIRQDSDTSKYLSEFQNIELNLGNKKTVDDWYGLYNKLLDWQINLIVTGIVDWKTYLKIRCEHVIKNFHTSLKKTMKTGYCKTQVRLLRKIL